MSHYQCFIDGWMTESKKAAHCNMMGTLTVDTVSKADRKADGVVKDRKNERERARRVRQNTWFDPNPKPEARQRGFGE